MSGSNLHVNLSQGETLFNRILLVEDDPSHGLLIQRAVAPLVGELEVARTVGMAMERLEKSFFNLVITDLSLPDSDGITHVKAFQEAQPGVAVVVLTVATRIEDVVAAMRYGARDFILKSFSTDFRELLRLSLSRVYSALSLEEERTKLQTAIEISDDGLALIDSSGLIRYGNGAFQRLKRRAGCEGDNFISFLSTSLANGQVIAGQVQEKLKAITAGGVWNTEVQSSVVEQDWYTLTISGLDSERIRDLEGRKEAVAWFRDITELKRKERFQRELISTTTHDLKGPMGAIITGAELVSDLVENQKAKDILLRVQSAAHGVVNLIDEFLSARRLEEGSLILRPSKHNLKVLFEDPKSNFETIAHSRKIDLQFAISDSATVYVDKMGFQRVIGNLLSNAIKFTPSGGSVKVSATIRDSDGYLLVQVSDSGSGIEAGELKRIFERYSRLEQHQEYAGTGLGLFVVKSIVEAHGGFMQVESAVGVGTTFLVSFPADPPVNERGELISLDFAK
jgi:signal transduction histidine kinase